MKGFVVYPTYRLIDGKAYVYLFGRLKNGESFLTIKKVKPYFYIKETDLNKAKDCVGDDDPKFETKRSKSKNVDGDNVFQVIVSIPSDVSKLRKIFEANDIVCYEADIRFVYRYMIDNDIKGCLDIQGKYKVGQYVNRIYEDPEIKAVEPYNVQLKTLSFDIETDGNAKSVYCISMYVDGYKKVLFVKDKGHKDLKLKNAEIFENERAMLEFFRDKIIEIDPDVITGWNVIDFDFRVLRDRFKAYKIPMVFGRAEWESSIRIQSDFFRDSTADIAGRQVLDGIALLKNNFVRLNDYKLDTAAETFLGKKKKIQFEGDKAKEVERLYKEEPQKLVDYNYVDAKLVTDILNKKGLIDLTVQRSLLTGMQMDRVSASIASLDSLYLRETKKKGIVCNSIHFSESNERIKGGYVKDSTPGIYDYIIVCDFKSLYPSIIRTFNIDPLSFTKSDKNVVVAPNGAKFENKDGILPLLIQRLWQMRDRAKKKKDDIASYAIKITMNSFFGVLANPNCRYYSLDIANAITSFGRSLVQESAEEVEKLGYKVIYGDTDSIFIDSKAKDYKDSVKVGKLIQSHINDYYNNKVKKEFKRENFLELEFEKVYKRFIMPRVRGYATGAKKRYAGLKTDGKKEKMDFVGLEFVRRDWTELAKQFQFTILNKIFHKEEIQDYIVKFVNEVKEGKHDDLLVYVKALRKPLEYYTKTTPPHVKAAKQLDKLESNIIKYVLTVDGPQPIQKINSKIDYDHYIEKQLKPIADSVLVFFDYNFDDLLSGSKQKSLFEF